MIHILILMVRSWLQTEKPSYPGVRTWAQSQVAFQLESHWACNLMQPKIDNSRLLWILDISRYFSYFLSLYLLDKETQHDTYLNPCSEFILNFLDSIYSQITPFHGRSFLLELDPLSSDYALFSNHDCGYADLSKHLWLCMSKRVESLAICFFIISYLNIILKYTKL